MAKVTVNIPRESTHLRLAEALELIALNNSSSAESLDTDCRQMLDGTNTTRVFWSWFPRALAAGETDRYKLLCRFGRMMAQAWKDKTYTLRSYDESVSGVTTMTPMDDLADKKTAQLYTEKTVVVDDWTDEDPMTWYIRANALSLEDGTMNVIAIEGEDAFDITGESAPVYSFSLALWIREWNDGTYNFISYKTVRATDYYPDAGDVGLDNIKRPITWHPSFPGGLNSKGALTSGAGIKPYIFVSSTDGIVTARKMTVYEGLWNDCDTRWLLRMWQLRHYDLENSNIAEGCTNYNYQYKVTATEENVKRVLITIAQANNLLVGSTVSIGDVGSNTNLDRWQPYTRNIIHLVKISSIEKVTVNGVEYAAVNLDTDSAITTTATTYISTMPWHSGDTEKLPGHKDGCTVSLTAGKTPLRVAGVEILDGAYAVGLDPLYNVTSNPAGGYDYAVYECRDSQKLSGAITADYKNTGIEYTGLASGWNYVKAFITTKLGILFPKTFGGSTTTFFKSAFFGASSAGVCCPWRFASLYSGGAAGLAAELGNGAPGGSSWYGRPRLCGAGKKRGEWTA